MRPVILEPTLTSVYHPQNLRMDSPHGVSLMQRVDHPVVDPLQNGSPALGWEGDPRLCMYVCPADDVFILLRFEHDGEYRVVCVSPVGGDMNPEEVNKLIRRLQGRKCAQTGGRLWKTSEVDHRVPLFRVWREHRDMEWPALLAFWGLPNLQIINRDAHAAKCAAEATSRRRIVLPAPAP